MPRMLHGSLISTRNTKVEGPDGWEKGERIRNLLASSTEEQISDRCRMRYLPNKDFFYLLGFSQAARWFCRDGISWELIPLPTGTSLGYDGIIQIAASPTRIVANLAVGTRRKIFYATGEIDNPTWTETAAINEFSLKDIIYSDSAGLFIAVSGSTINSIRTSPDGVTWTLRDAGIAIDRIEEFQGRFVGWNDSGGIWTNDDITDEFGWVAAGFNIGDADVIRDLDGPKDSGRLCMVGQDGGTEYTWYSDDAGQNWTRLGGGFPWGGDVMTYGGGKYITNNRDFNTQLYESVDRGVTFQSFYNDPGLSVDDSASEQFVIGCYGKGIFSFIGNRFIDDVSYNDRFRHIWY